MKKYDFWLIAQTAFIILLISTIKGGPITGLGVSIVVAAIMMLKQIFTTRLNVSSLKSDVKFKILFYKEYEQQFYCVIEKFQFEDAEPCLVVFEKKDLSMGEFSSNVFLCPDHNGTYIKNNLDNKISRLD